MQAYVPLILAFLELTFVTIAILFLHSVRRSLSTAPFYMVLGAFFVFGQFLTSAGLMVDPGIRELQVSVGGAVVLAPLMCALLVVYVLDGTAAARRLILGFAALLFTYFYLAFVTAVQCGSGEYSAADSDTLRYLGGVFLHSRRIALAAVAAQAADLIVVPILFQLFNNVRCRLFLAIAATLVFAQVIDTFIFHAISAPGSACDWMQVLRTTYVARAAAMIWVAGLTSFYLHLYDVRRGPLRRPLDILVGFFGDYFQTQQLRRHIREWEGRYEIVVEHSSDLIFLLDRDGRVLNANQAAIAVLGLNEERLTGFFLPGIMQLPSGDVCRWTEVWNQIHPPPSMTAATVVPQEWHATTPTGRGVLLDVRISGAELFGTPVALIIARDVTEQRRLEEERRRLEQQLIHTQRLEAVGLLAGGIAHDFNNLIQSILGAADRLRRHCGRQVQALRFIDTISTAAERASRLTKQLLSFARRRQPRIERIAVDELVDQAQELFEPLAHKDLDLRVLIAPVPMFIRGDRIQLQQVLLNMLLNARDAVMEKKPENPRIVVRVQPAEDHLPGWDIRPRRNLDPENVVCIRIRDNGAGIPDGIRHRIFEPFFTTKDVGRGTGMGLAMAYGCITSHHGWIHVESREGQGTEFFIYLPRER